MKITAKLNHLRIAPRKVRLVANMIKKKKTDKAQAILSFTVKRGARPILKLLNSAIANAKNNFQLDENNLYISKITIDEGPKLKRWRARSRGRAMEIQKKTSHITIELDEIKPGKKPQEKKVAEKEKPAKSVPVKKETTEQEIKPQEVEKTEKQDTRLLKQKAKTTTGMPKPKERGGIKRFFRRKSF